MENDQNSLPNWKVSATQTADPEISLNKYNAELTLFKENNDIHNSRGIFLIKENFPVMTFIFCAPQIKPTPIVFCTRLDFTNYDIEPISITFINPLSGDKLRFGEMPIHFRRKVPLAIPQSPVQQFQFQDLLVGYGNDDFPFLCLPGVREYHNHPAHTGDSWLLHRGKGGEGTLGFLLESLYTYGIPPLQLNFNLLINVNGFTLNANVISQ